MLSLVSSAIARRERRWFNTSMLLWEERNRLTRHERGSGGHIINGSLSLRYTPTPARIPVSSPHTSRDHLGSFGTSTWLNFLLPSAHSHGSTPPAKICYKTFALLFFSASILRLHHQHQHQPHAYCARKVSDTCSPPSLLTHCYEEQYTNNPNLTSTMGITFTLELL